MTAAIRRFVNVAWADRVLHDYNKRLVQMHQKFPKVLPRIVNQVGDRAKTQVIRNLAPQTGLPRKTIVKAIGDPMKASFGKLSYEMRTRGGNIRLKYLNPKETPEGVVAKPFGKPSLYPGTFMRGGWWPNRVNVEKFDGHVFYRLNRSGTRITYARSGVVIPTEMLRHNTLAAFNRIAGPVLRERVDAALAKLVP